MSGSGEMSYPLVLWLQVPRQNVVVVGFLLVPPQADQEVLILDHQKGEVNLRHCPKSIHIRMPGETAKGVYIRVRPTRSSGFSPYRVMVNSPGVRSLSNTTLVISTEA